MKEFLEILIDCGLCFLVLLCFRAWILDGVQDIIKEALDEQKVK